MRKRVTHVLSLMLAVLMFLSSLTSGMGTVSAAEKKSNYQTIIEFEDANRFEQNGNNYIDSSMFSGYSGSGYLYLVSGWGEVGFTVPADGEYKITVVSNADTYKENWLYLDNDGAGQLTTSGNKWESHSNTYYLSAGEHKFGVSTSWGYTALDYVAIEAVNVEVEETEPSTEETSEDTSMEESTEETSTEETSTEESSTEESSSETDEFATRFEFEDANRYEQNGSNRVESSTFAGYSGSGYLYLAYGWGEVGFKVPVDGEYKITIASNADCYKENWLYLDNNGAGTLTTSGNKWETYSNTYNLAAGEHKFGVSTSWGYTALDYVTVELVSEEESSEEVTTEEETTEEETTVPDEPVVDPTPSGDGMYVKNGRLYDANGNDFVMRGVNVAHDWYRDYTDTSLEAIAKLGSNCARIVLGDGTQYPFIPASEVEDIIEKCEELGMICIVEVHDHTGADDTSRLNSAVEYWKNIKDLLNAHKDYVIVNIANEWLGTWGKGSVWTSAYQSAIKDMRNAGIENVIMVDAAGYGQEAATCIDNCQSVLSADPTGNTMFSIHMYSVVGKDSSTVKNAIDGMLSKGVSFCIGEFGHYQGGGEVDEATIMQYCTEKSIGYIAWSWKGNGGDDDVLDMSEDWAGNNLTDWGAYVFDAENTGIKATSVMAYTLKKYDGTVNPTPTPVPTPDDDDDVIIDVPAVDLEGVDAGYLSEYDNWNVYNKGDDGISTISTTEALSNGGIRVNIDLGEEEYPCLYNQVKGLDLTGTKTIDILVRNNCLKAVQIQPIFKVGELWDWKEYDQYQKIPANSAVMLSFEVTGCDNLDEVNSMIFRIQGAGSKTAGSIDFYSIMSDYDYAADPFEHAIDELNRPKSANYFTWDYPENSWTNTTDFTCDANGVITVNFKNVTSEDAAGPQTETCPGMGEGIDITAYSKVKSTITNNTTEDIHVTLVMKTTGNWTWQENAGTVDGVGGERIIPAGESVEVVYEISGSEWKSKATDWAYTGELDGADDLRAIAYKIYAGEGDTVSGSVTISDFEFLF